MPIFKTPSYLFAFPYHFCRDAHHNGIWRNVLVHDASGADHRPVTNLGSFKDHGSSPYEHIIPNADPLVGMALLNNQHIFPSEFPLGAQDADVWPGSRVIAENDFPISGGNKIGCPYGTSSSNPYDALTGLKYGKGLYYGTLTESDTIG